MVALPLFALLLLPLLLLVASVFFLFTLTCTNPKQSSKVQLQDQIHHKSISSSPSSSSSSSSSCETCHMCGGLRLVQRRRIHFSARVSSAIQEASQKIRHTFSRITKPLRNVEVEISLVLKQFFYKFTGDQKEAQDKNKMMNFKDFSSITSSVMGSTRRSSTVPPTSATNAGKDSNIQTTCSDMEEKSDLKQKNPHSHKIILEILMSPSDGMEETSSSSTNASELRIKLETNATLQDLSSLKEVLERKIAEKCGDLEGNGTFCLPIDNNMDTCRAWKTLKTEMNSSNMVSVKENNTVADETVAIVRVNFSELEQCNQKQQDSQHQKSNQELQSDGKSCVNDHQGSFDLNVTHDVLISGETMNLRTNNIIDGNVPIHASLESIEHQKECNIGSEGSRNGLGSLQITFLKTVDESDDRRDQDPNRKSGTQGVSPLASINVTRKCGKSLEVSSFHKDTLNESSTSYEEKNVTEEQEHSPMQKHTCKSGDVGCLSSSKEKKKKKNRGKKQKQKMIIDGAQEEMQDITKIALEATKHSSGASGKETGCVCGAAKGGSHVGSCPYPFTSSGSMLQRKIKKQYDELVQSNASKTLTLAQVGRFTTCLVETKATLQQKSELIQRKFTIAKSLLSKADKSSFDRLCGQIYGLEMEQKKLEEDTVVYNRLQEQLKLSPAYKKMLEYGRAHFELQPRTGQLIENLESGDMEMSFEEFLAQEKKDAFWQRKHGFTRSTVHAR